jgi:hypothetical protein
MTQEEHYSKVVIGALPARFVSSHRPLAIFLLVLPASEDTANRLAPNFSIAFLDGEKIRISA